ncbi:MAG: hypothetical protein O2782_19905 [bacterium]|nr:hypothetical protein [bacterium]
MSTQQCPGPKVRKCLRVCRTAVLGSLLLLAAPARAEDVIAAIEVRGNTRTKSAVVLRELLFHAGEPLQAAAVEESRRNLRSLLYLGRVQIHTAAAAPGSVRVVVEVDDLYARALSPLLAGDDEEISYGAVAVDYNLFGQGQYARLTAFDDARSGRRVTAQFGDPRIRSTQLRLATEAGWAEEGHQLGVSLSQPFYQLATTWAYGASASSYESWSRRYRSGTLAALYADRLDAASLWLARSYGDDIKIRPGLQLTASDDSFVPLNSYTYAPANRRRVVSGLSLTVWQPRYVTERFIQYLGPDEDFQVGSFLTLQAGLSTRALGSDRDYPYAALTLSPRFRLASGWLLLSSMELRSRWHGGRYENLRTSSSLRLLGRRPRWPGSPAIALRLTYDTIDRPQDTGSQYLLGGDSGLRGYLPRQFDGSRRLTAGVELRPVFQHRRSWALGGVLFADAGGAWDGDPSLHAALGAGLRLGLPRVYDTPVVRLDLARGLAGDVAGGSAAGIWQLSFGLGQYF